MRRVISLWLPRLPVDLIRRRRKPTQPIDAPLVATGMAQGRAIVLAVDDEAAAAGIAPGMGLADARVLMPRLAAIEADPMGDQRALGQLADWCERYTPLVALDGHDGLFLDVTGAAHLFGGEQAMLAELVRRVRGFGLAARACLADTPGAAWAVARFAELPQGFAVLFPGGGEAALRPLPPAALRLPPDLAEDLRRLGLRRIADLLRLEQDKARAPLAQRFGEIVWRRIEQALGRPGDTFGEPISPRRPLIPHRAELAFAEPIATAEDIARATHKLIARLAVRFATEAKGARRLELAFFRVDGVVERVSVGTARPSRDATHLLKLFEKKLETVAPGFGIDLAVLTAPVVETSSPVQSMFPDPMLPDQGKPALSATGLAELVDRLTNRLGPNSVWRLSPRESHMPERAARRIAALSPAIAKQDWNLPPRPLRLLDRPEPIDMIAADDVPGMFRWHAHLHRVRAAEGPERLAPEWWLGQKKAEPQGVTRDYWRVEDDGGRRFWIFRRAEGAKTDGTRNAWFMHGEFA